MDSESRFLARFIFCWLVMVLESLHYCISIRYRFAPCRFIVPALPPGTHVFSISLVRSMSAATVWANCYARKGITTLKMFS
jgi:hypothetical protein